jgi:AcrR family transcriptional regulator
MPAVADAAADADPFRQRLLDGLGASIGERGYRASTVADIVRHARTSKRTFYGRFDSKEQCFVELLRTNNVLLRDEIGSAVDPEADWRDQVRQAVRAYVAHIEAHPAITLSWIRELPSLGVTGRPVQRDGLQQLTELLVGLSGGPGFRRDGVSPLTPSVALILLGGLRELTALIVEDGSDIRELVEPAVEASIALLGGRP